MGFLKKLVKTATNPAQAIKNPKQAIKNGAAMGLDPAGSFVRMGTTGNAAPVNGRQMIDPSGKVIIKEEPIVAPNTYKPGRAMQLSPGAQALMDDMKARAAARAAGTAYTPAASSGFRPTPGGGVQPIMQLGQPAPKPQPIAPPVMSAPLTAPAAAAPAVPSRPRSFSGLMMADGGEVGAKKGLVRGYAHYESKVHTPKARKR